MMSYLFWYVTGTYCFQLEEIVNFLCPVELSSTGVILWIAPVG